MTEARRVPHDTGGRRLTLRRVAALTAALAGVSALTLLLGAGYLWPLFTFPLILAAVFFHELGSLAVTFWLGNFIVLSYGLGAPPSTSAVREALAGTALFFLAGLVLGRVQRRGHAAQERLAASRSATGSPASTTTAPSSTTCTTRSPRSTGTAASSP